MSNTPTPPSLRLSKINHRLRYVVVMAYDLRDLGFLPADKSQPDWLYHESDFPKICEKLEKHFAELRAGFTV